MSASSKKILIFILLLKLLSLILTEQGYYQVLDEFSFDMRNEKDRKSFYQNYIREGNVVVNKQNLTMNAAVDNSYGLIYSIKPILVNNFHAQVTLSTDFGHLRGSVFAIFFFENDISELLYTKNNIENRKYLGFLENFKGISIEILTSGEAPLVQMTTVRAQIHDGKTKKPLENIHRRNMDESCESHRFKNELKNLWIEVNKGVLSLKLSDSKYLLQNCLGVFKASSLKAPFRIAVATINGGIDNQFYLDSPRLQKLTLFNMMYESRKNYTIFPFNNYSDKNINKDLIISIDQKQIEKFEKEILEIKESEKISVLGKNNRLFEEYYSDKNLNNSYKNKSEIYNKIRNADLIEKAIDQVFIEELSRRNSNNEVKNDVEFYMEKRNVSDANSFKTNETLSDNALKLQTFNYLNEKMIQLLNNIKEINNLITNKNALNPNNNNYYQHSDLNEHQENLIENLNRLNAEVETKSNSILNNLKSVKENLKTQDFNSTIKSINQIFNEIDSVDLINTLRKLKADLSFITISNSEITNTAKNISDNLEELILSLKKAEEKDLFLLINLKDYVRNKANELDKLMGDRKFKLKLFLSILLVNLVLIYVIYSKLKKKAEKRRVV